MRLQRQQHQPGRCHALAAGVAVLCVALIPLPRPLSAQSDQSVPLLAGSTAAHRSGPLYFDFELLAFGTPDRRTEAIISISIDGSRLSPSVSSRGWGYGAVARLELARDGVTKAVSTGIASLNCTGRLGSAHGIPVYLSTRVEPGLYGYRLEVTDPHRERGNPTSRSAGRLVVPSFAGPGPLLTSLAVATDSVAVQWNGAPGGLQVNATHLVADDMPPLIYFEVHGVAPGAFVWTDLTLEPLGEAGALDGLLRGKARPYTIRYLDRAPDDPGSPIRSTLRLELASLRPGPYLIRAMVSEADGGLAGLPMTSTLELVDAHRSGYSSVVCEDARGATQVSASRLDGDPAAR